ncbi:hypothetical protein, partial [Actinoallomurus acaciae]
MRLRQLLGDATGLPGATLRAVSGAMTGITERRQVHTTPGRARIRVRGVHKPGTEAVARSLVDQLMSVAGVARAEVNAPLGFVFVMHDDETPLDVLLDVVEAVEAAHGMSGEPFSRLAHPSRQTVLRDVALAGAYLAGGGAAVVGRLVRATPLPPGVATLMAMADASPQVRQGLERRIGHPASDVILGTGVIVSHVLAYQPSGPVINSVHRIMRIAEMRAHAEAWDRRCHHIAPTPGVFQAAPLDVPPRPVPLPYGAVEHAAWTIPAAIVTATGTYALSRDADRA